MALTSRIDHRYIKGDTRRAVIFHRQHRDMNVATGPILQQMKQSPLRHATQMARRPQIIFPLSKSKAEWYQAILPIALGTGLTQIPRRRCLFRLGRLLKVCLLYGRSNYTFGMAFFCMVYNDLIQIRMAHGGLILTVALTLSGGCHKMYWAL